MNRKPALFPDKSTMTRFRPFLYCSQPNSGHEVVAFEKMQCGQGIWLSHQKWSPQLEDGYLHQNGVKNDFLGRTDGRRDSRTKNNNKWTTWFHKDPVDGNNFHCSSHPISNDTFQVQLFFQKGLVFMMHFFFSFILEIFMMLFKSL